MNMSDMQISAFWSKVAISDNKRDCWNWTASKKEKGYGCVRINKKGLLAHRVAFELANGWIPEGFMVCHICDNPSCCNPNHLMLGTTKSNAADMLLKHRQKKKEYAAKGEVNGNSKLTSEDVLQIRKLYQEGSKTQKELAVLFNTTQPNIGNIVRRETWSHV